MHWPTMKYGAPPPRRRETTLQKMELHLIGLIVELSEDCDGTADMAIEVVRYMIEKIRKSK